VRGRQGKTFRILFEKLWFLKKRIENISVLKDHVKMAL
jgi:hypothetical protein